MAMTPITSRNFESISSRTTILIKGLQGGEETPEQDTNAGQNDVLLQRDDHALLREGRVGYPPAGTQVQPKECQHRRRAQPPLPEADQQQPG
jgi:hypothetical protein